MANNSLVFKIHQSSIFNLIIIHNSRYSSHLKSLLLCYYISVLLCDWEYWWYWWYWGYWKYLIYNNLSLIFQVTNDTSSSSYSTTKQQYSHSPKSPSPISFIVQYSSLYLAIIRTPRRKDIISPMRIQNNKGAIIKHHGIENQQRNYNSNTNTNKSAAGKCINHHDKLGKYNI